MRILNKGAKTSYWKYSPHFLLAALFLATGKPIILISIANGHLLVIPFMTGAFHWMKSNKHLSKSTLYYDLHHLNNKNPNTIATYE